MTSSNTAYRDWLNTVADPFEAITLLEKSEVSNLELSDITEALDEYVRLFQAEIASPAEVLTLSRAYPDEDKYSLAVIDKEYDQDEPVVIGGPASVEVVDREGHIITVAAMKRAFERFMANFRTRNAMVLHSDVQVGWALPAYISKTGKIYKSGVTGDHLFFITELRNDTKISKKVLQQIEDGKMKSYSIAGSATSVETVKHDSGVVMQVNDMELAEVTICEQGVNQRAKFELMKSDADRPTSSCVDGSCLIKSQEHVHSETEIFMNNNGEIDTVGSFNNWVQKEETMQKTSLEQLDDHLEKGIGDVARGAGKAVGAAVEGVKNVGSALKEGYKKPKVNDEGTITNLSPREAARRFKPVPMPESTRQKKQAAWDSSGSNYAERVAAAEKQSRRTDDAIIRKDDSQQGYWMDKSHLEGCGCASCTQRTGDDDTARTATDTQGRPTLGHMGHGNVVAIMISRMQRKARTKEQQRKGQLGVANQARSKAFSGLELPDLAGKVSPEKLKRADRSSIRFGQREDARAGMKTPAGRRRQRYESDTQANAEIARMGASLDAKRPLQSMEKAVYDYLRKDYDVPSKEDLKEAGNARQQQAEAKWKEANPGKELPSQQGRSMAYRGTAAEAFRRPKQTGDERKAASQALWRKKNPDQEDPASFADMLKALIKNQEPSMESPAVTAPKGPSRRKGLISEGMDSDGNKTSSVIGNLVRSAQRYTTMNMEKQAPEWTTPQTETPLHKFLDHADGGK